MRHKWTTKRIDRDDTFDYCEVCMVELDDVNCNEECPGGKEANCDVLV